MDLTWEDLSDRNDPRCAVFGFTGNEKRVDPYLHWAALTEFRDVGGPRSWFAVLIELKTGLSAADFASGVWDRNDPPRIQPPDDWRAWMKIPRWYVTPSAGLAESRFLSARVAPPFFAALADRSSSLSTVIARFAFGWALDRDIGAGGGSAEPGTVRKWSVGEPATVGVIDDGIAFAHRRLRDATGRSRIEHFWDQRERHPERPIASPPWPVAGDAVPYGYEFDRDGANGLDARLDAASKACRPAKAPIAAGLLDEDALYRDTIGWNAARRVRHGTHVLDVAAGEGPSTADDGSRIVAVQLPRDVTLDTAGHLLAPHVTDGLRYIFDRAESMGDAAGGATVPVVVNLSYGTIGGPHDGSSLLERAMDEMVTQRRAAGHPTAIVVPAGNHLQWRCHARVEVLPGKSALLQWRVPPDQPVPTFMEIWLPYLDPLVEGEDPPVHVRVVPPGERATVSGEVKPGMTAQCVDATPREGAPAADTVVATVSFRNAGVTVKDPDKASFYCDRPMVLVTVSPTRSTGGLRSAAPGGLWRIEIARPAPPFAVPVGRPWIVDAWIQRTDAPVGFSRRVVQSRFEDPDYQVFDRYTGRLLERDSVPSTVRRSGTLNAIATGSSTIVVGAARVDRTARKEGVRAPSVYATSGPALPTPGAVVPVRDGPDVAAIADENGVIGGRLAAATRSAGAVVLGGSSVAAPVVTRRIARSMGEGNDVERATVVAMAEPIPGGDPARAGAGVVPERASGRIER